MAVGTRRRVAPAGALEATLTGLWAVEVEAARAAGCVAAAVAAGELAIVGATYHLDDGRVVLRNIIGDVGEKVDA